MGRTALVNGSGVEDADGETPSIRPSRGEELAPDASPPSSTTQAPELPTSHDTGFGQVIGDSPSMRKLYPICARLAASDVPVVIEGETGTGKEVLAEAIHAASPRASRPFVVFDCTASSAALIDAALFGHERGAFTGAVGARPGVFEEANHGTLLIDEIGDLDLTLQAKLLRAIQKGQVRRLGGDRWVQVDVRVLAATRRDLEKEVRQGRFRDDLFFRLAIARVTLPPLRERQGDVERLARHFWTTNGGAEDAFPAAELTRLEAHPWPGNVRELANTIARIVALGDMAFSRPLFMLDASGNHEPGGGSSGPDFIEEVMARGLELGDARDLVVREFERRYVARAIQSSAGDYRRAAASAGVGERYLRMIRARTSGTHLREAKKGP